MEVGFEKMVVRFGWEEYKVIFGLGVIFLEFLKRIN